MKYIIVQTGKHAFLVARSTGGGPYRTLCKCEDVHSAGIIKDVLEKSNAVP